jgi:lipoprotein signal peptidase
MGATLASNPESRTAAQDRALHDPFSHARIWLTTALVLALDLFSKSWVFSHLGPTERRVVIPGLIMIQRSMNDGAVFGSLTGMVWLFTIASLFALGFVVWLFVGSERRHRALHLALGLILAGALGNLHDRLFIQADVVRLADGQKLIGRVVQSPEEDVVQIGSWPDGARARRFPRGAVIEQTTQGVVRDFIRFIPQLPTWVPVVGGQDAWPWIFNFADSALVCGVLVMMTILWREHRRVRSRTNAALEAEAGAGGAPP